MSTRSEKRLELLVRFFHRLADKSEKGISILVEGKKDRSSLRKLGVNGEVVCIKCSGAAFPDVLDSVKGNEIILFVDFDDSGVALAKDITAYLEGRGVKVDSFFWSRIRSLVRRDVRDVEGLPSYLEKLKKWASYC